MAIYLIEQIYQSSSPPLDSSSIEHWRSLNKKNKAVEQITALANRGNTYAAYILGLVHEHGISGLPSNPQEAFQWYRKAAEQGDAWAQKKIKALSNLE